MDLDFDTWFDIFSDKCRELGWKGLIDIGLAQMDYDMDTYPEEAARVFVSEME